MEKAAADDAWKKKEKTILKQKKEHPEWEWFNTVWPETTALAAAAQKLATKTAAAEAAAKIKQQNEEAARKAEEQVCYCVSKAIQPAHPDCCCLEPPVGKYSYPFGWCTLFL